MQNNVKYLQRNSHSSLEYTTNKQNRIPINYQAKNFTINTNLKQFQKGSGWLTTRAS